ncbi:MAG: hypothetical protein EU542_07595, partial [Promethearchaeota archaeon]
TVKPTFKDNTKIFDNLLSAVLSIALLDSILVGGITYVMNLIMFGENKILNPTLFLVIPTIVLFIAGFLSTRITSAVSFFVYKRGLNPDVYVCPVMSTVNNILVTLIYAGVLAILRPWTVVETAEGKVYMKAQPNDMILTYVAIIVAVAFIGIIIYVALKNWSDEEYKKMMKECSIAVVFSASIGTVTGVILSSSEEALELYPQLLIVFPALIGTLVDQCAITSNILITNFSAGYIEPELKSAKNPKVISTLLGVGAGGLVNTVLLGFIGTFISIGSLVEIHGAWFTFDIIKVIFVTLMSNVFGFIIVSVLIFLLSILAFKKEWDPDNFSIPLVACLADALCAGFILLLSHLILL